MKKVLIYTDGACLGNPGPGGWGAILRVPGTGHRKEIAGGFRLTTNNRMEITAALEALGALREPCTVELFTDSRYLCDAVEKGWLDNWQRSGFVRKGKRPVMNIDLWKRLIPLLAAHKVRFFWIRGHAGHPENERCDELATTLASRSELPVDTPYEQMLAAAPDLACGNLADEIGS